MTIFESNITLTSLFFFLSGPLHSKRVSVQDVLLRNHPFLCSMVAGASDCDSRLFKNGEGPRDNAKNRWEGNGQRTTFSFTKTPKKKNQGNSLSYALLFAEIP